jgi:hypothetical protein
MEAVRYRKGALFARFEPLHRAEDDFLEIWRGPVGISYELAFCPTFGAYIVCSLSQLN